MKILTINDIIRTTALAVFFIVFVRDPTIKIVFFFVMLVGALITIQSIDLMRSDSRRHTPGYILTMLVVTCVLSSAIYFV